MDKLDEQLAAPGMWDDQSAARQLSRQRSRLMDAVLIGEALGNYLEELQVISELLRENAGLSELKEELEKLEKSINEIHLKTLLNGEHDQLNAIVNIHPGAGGTESHDWAQILLRMYLRWIENKGFQYQIVDYLPGEEAGIKNVTLTVSGNYAYGYLKSENGVHRLVRISPFDANKRRHTSFASVFVYPEIDDSIEVDINPKDLRIDTYRSQGAGGQHVNVTDSAVRITHLPTKIVAQCQNERSQHQNKDVAMKILRSRLYEHYLKERKTVVHELQEGKKDIGWGSQIRSYIFQPYQLIKDHRTNKEIGNLNAVLDGWIDPFIEAYLAWQKQ
ncbi:MAG: peptide chain release factor 2 [Candidatus Schekmanbacteria bacterium]|nr:peptide chain release factor 2 [Candidatus Schekmanbacteria bacterium]